MSSVKDIIKSLNEVLASEKMKSFVKELVIISQVLYKIHNAQKQFKFYQAFRKMERNIRKFANLELLQLTNKHLQLIGEDNDFNSNYSDEYMIELKGFIKKSIILLQLASSASMEGTILSQKELFIEHFISQHILLISCASKIFSILKIFIEDFKVIYGKICLHLKMSNEFATEVKIKRKRRLCKTSIARFEKDSNGKQSLEISEDTKKAKLDLDMSRDVGEVLSRDLGEVLSRDVGEVLSRDVGKDMSCDLGEVLSRDSGKDMSRDLGEVLSRDVGEVLSRDVGEVLSRDLGEVLSRDVGEDMSRDVGEVLSRDKISDELKASNDPLKTFKGSEKKKRKRNRKRNRKNRTL